MDAILSALFLFPLSPASALVFNLLPLAYLTYHIRLWYRPEIVRNLDFLLGAAGILLGLSVSLRLLVPENRQGTALLVVLLHLTAILTTVTLVSLSIRATGSSPRPRAQPGSGGGGSAGDAYDYRPMPLSRGIEAVSWDQLVVAPELKQELMIVVQLLKDARLTKQYGIEVPKGILLAGPPGTGKTTIARAIASNANLSFFVLQSDEIVSKWVGESEKNLSRLFESAQRHAPSVIFIDEVDSIGKSRSGNQVWADNLLNHLLTLVDGVVKTEGLYIVAATNRADLVDAALKRSGRLNKVIEVPLPDFENRKDLFKVYLSRLTLQDTVSLDDLSRVTNGCSGADIKEICNQAGLNAFRRESASQKKRQFSVSKEDLDSAVREFLGRGKSPVPRGNQ